MSDLSAIEKNKKIIERFYSAFQRLDGETMASCHGPGAKFEDAIFKLEGDRIGSMWKMFCKNGKDLKVTFSEIEATDSTGRAHWVAKYTFSPTGRKVTNRITAHFQFENGLIKTHQDLFGFWRWSIQALGLLGLLLGWSQAVRNRVQTIAYKNLTAFEKS